MTQVVFNENVRQQLLEIAIFIAEQTNDIDLALRYTGKLEKRVVNRLEIFSKSGQFVGIDEGEMYFKVVVDKYTFTYRIDRNLVIVEDVSHGRENH